MIKEYKGSGYKIYFYGHTAWSVLEQEWYSTATLTVLRVLLDPPTNEGWAFFVFQVLALLIPLISQFIIIIIIIIIISSLLEPDNTIHNACF